MYVLGGRNDGKWFESKSLTNSDLINKGNSINHLKVVCRGAHIEISVNEHYLAAFNDSSFTDGNIGVIATSEKPDIEVAFDNIKVYSLD